jgi:hypothetical protein
VAVSIPCDSGIVFLSVRNDGQMAPIITRTVLAPFMVWIAYQNMARMAREMIATYEPQKPQDALAMTGNGMWWSTPMAPLKAMTIETIKKLSATMPSDSRQVSPTATMPAANCHVAALKASEIQYAMNDVTPHFRSCGATGSRSLFVLHRISYQLFIVDVGFPTI